MHGDREGDQGSPATGGQSIIETLLAHPDPVSRKDAAIALGEIHDYSAIVALARALHDPIKDVRGAVATSLASKGPLAIGALTEALADGNWMVRYRAAEVLGSIRDERSITALIHALEDGRDHVRYMAAKGLGKLGDRRAIGPLSAALADENEFVRRAVKGALESLG
ncbi:MAG: HEAT repeat domain-containing protein [Methanomicrobiales archaeon]|jgi:HEAT repeat protein